MQKVKPLLYLKNLKILYVEDDESIKTALCELLKLHVKRIDSAKNGMEGLSLFEKKRYDIVITDIYMPIMNGLKMVKEIKNINKDIPIIILTAFNEVSYLNEAIELGVDKYLTKPITKEKLFFKLNKIAENIFHKRKAKLQEKILLTKYRENSMHEMLSMIAHQWRQPLAIVSAKVNNLLLDIDFNEYSKDSIEKELNNINSDIENLSTIINDFSHLFAPNEEKKEKQINTILEESLTLIDGSLKDFNILVSKKYESSATLLIYSDKLMQVYMNIFINAIELFSEREIKKPKLEIEVCEKDKFIITSICDNGGGIDKDIKSKIFEPYFSTKNNLNGKGLGLYIAKIIVEKYLNGKIKVKNRDKGSCFCVYLAKKV